MVVRKNKAEELMKSLFISFRMGGAKQARRSLKKLKGQTNDQGVFNVFKYLSLEKNDKQFEIDMNEVMQIWNKY